MYCSRENNSVTFTRHAREDCLLNRGNAFTGTWNFDEKVGATRARMKLYRRFYTAGRVIGQQGRHLQRNPAVNPAGGLVDRTEQVGCPDQILQRKFVEQLLARFTLNCLLRIASS